jgi:hypothetical protein
LTPGGLILVVLSGSDGTSPLLSQGFEGWHRCCFE